VESRGLFCRKLAELKLTHLERAVALLWYYRQSQEFEERSASDLSKDLHEEGFPKPNVTKLHNDLSRSHYTVRGTRDKTFQLDLRQINELDQKFTKLLKVKKVEIHDLIIPSEWVSDTRLYLERLVDQINGCYEYGFYDGSAALCRRLMESLIIEIYISQRRHHEIKQNGVFLPLDRLISHIRSDHSVSLGRNTPKTMTDVKQLGDTAAHDRVYITHQQDIDDIKARYRRMIKELLVLSNIT